MIKIDSEKCEQCKITDSTFDSQNASIENALRSIDMSVVTKYVLFYPRVYLVLVLCIFMKVKCAIKPKKNLVRRKLSRDFHHSHEYLLENSLLLHSFILSLEPTTQSHLEQV